MTEAMEMGATKAEPEKECGVVLKLVDRDRLISACLEREIKIDPTQSTRVLVAELSGWIQQKPAPAGGFFVCDPAEGGCGGQSGPDFEVCPFCGQGDPPKDEPTTVKAKKENGMNDAVEEKPNGKVNGKAHVAAKAEDAPKAKTIRGKRAPKEETSTAIEKAPVEAAAIVDPESATLDKIVQEINRLSGEENGAHWKQGRLMLRVFNEALWKSRKSTDGRLVYPKGFKAWAEAELDMNFKWAMLKMEVAKRFGEEDVRVVPFPILTIIVRAPEASHRKLLAECVEKSLTREAVKERVAHLRAKGGASPREVAAGRGAVTKTKKAKGDKITVAAIIGSQPLKFLCDKRGKKAPAMKLGAEPIEASISLVNDVVARVKIKLGNKGVVGSISFERVKD